MGGYDMKTAHAPLAPWWFTCSSSLVHVSFPLFLLLLLPSWVNLHVWCSVSAAAAGARSYFERWTKRGMEPSAYHHAPVWRHACTQACRAYLLAAPRAGLYINVRTGFHGFVFRCLPVKLIQWYIIVVFTLYLCTCTFLLASHNRIKPN